MSCGQDKIPRPAVFSSDNVTSNLVTHPNFANSYRVGSSVTYVCQLSYYVYNTEGNTLSLTTTCLPNGTWSRVADCVKHPCWDKLPPRPLNGRRDTKLVLGALSGMTNGSHVNFTCNPFYERVGPATVFCINGQWEKNIPECRPMKNVCKKRPWSAIPNGFLLSLKRVDFRNELDYGDKYDNVTVLLSAGYSCFPNFKFQINRNIELKSVGTQVLVAQNVNCVGEEAWEFVPRCILS